MRNGWVLILFLSISSVSMSQDLHLGVFGGVSNYQGDLIDGIYKQSKASIGVTLSYELTDHLMLRGGLIRGKITGSDKYSQSQELRLRNLSFESSLTELHLLGEYSPFDISQRRYTPYFFAGVALYHFNPYTIDSRGLQVFLKPLSTEGQGVPGYPDRIPYSLTQMSIPFGGGLRYAISDNVRVGIEIGLRKLFTDYVDDVSKTYIDEFDLFAARGAQAVEISYRGDEVPGGSPFYPTKGATRGGEKIKDYYYFSGIHLSFRLPGNNKARGKKTFTGNGGKKKGFGCPAVPL